VTDAPEDAPHGPLPSSTVVPGVTASPNAQRSATGRWYQYGAVFVAAIFGALVVSILAGVLTYTTISIWSLVLETL
jgi:hypothetical protein